MLEVRNTPERAEELRTTIKDLLHAGVLKRADGERWRVRLQFASNQLFGRRFRNCLRELKLSPLKGTPPDQSQFGNGSSDDGPPVDKQCSQTSGYELHEPGALVCQCIVRSDGYSGIGGILLDSSGRCLGCFSETVEAQLLASIMSSTQETAILELEGLAVATALDTFQGSLKSVRVVCLHRQSECASKHHQVQIPQP